MARLHLSRNEKYSEFKFGRIDISNMSILILMSKMIFKIFTTYWTKICLKIRNAQNLFIYELFTSCQTKLVPRLKSL